MSIKFAAAGSQKWLQVAVAKAPDVLDQALQRSGAISRQDTVDWRSPLHADNFREYRDLQALKRLGLSQLPNQRLSEFWPRRGPVWDALGVSRCDKLVLVEAKAHIPEAASPGTKASPASLKLIQRSLIEARKYYAPRSKADWTGTFYQYANRLAFQYLFAELNGLPSILVFLDFVNADDVGGPTTEAEWKGATRLIHALLGLPPDLRKFGVFHAYVDVQELKQLV